MKPCPYCAEEIQDSAVVCRHCGREIVPDALRQWAAAWNRATARERETAWASFSEPERALFMRLLEQQPPARTSILPFAIGCGFIVVALVAAFASWQLISSIGEDPLVRQAEEAKRVKHDAWYTCTEFVKDRLKAPAGAEFCPYREAVVTEAEGRYRVSGCVDAENSFGAKIRTAFNCELRANGSQWLLENISVE